MADKKLFELHAEVGKCSKGYYLKLLFSDGSDFLNKTNHLSDVISSTAYQLKSKGLLAQLEDGSIECIPLATEAKEATNSVTIPTGKMLRPADLTQFNPPDCHPVCKSFDFFGDKKCKNICASKFNL